MPDFLSVSTWRNIFTRHGQKIGWGLAVLFGLPLVIGFGWSQYAGRSQEAAAMATANSVIATVNGDPITKGDFNAEMRSIPERDTSGSDYSQRAGMAMQQLITKAVLQQEAKKRNVRPSDADVDRTIAQERARVLGK